MGGKVADFLPFVYVPWDESLRNALTAAELAEAAENDEGVSGATPDEGEDNDNDNDGGSQA